MRENAPREKSNLDQFLRQAASFREVIEEAPHLLHLMCQIGGLAVILNGILGVLDIFTIMSHAIYYVVNLYMVFFGVVTCITETHPENIPMVHENLKSTQIWMHEWAKGLTTLQGRGLFYIFQGCLAFVSSSTISLGMVIGVYMSVAGALCISMHLRQETRYSSIPLR
mmetsp:Transcript_21026/g.45523  ORF Transcript_21026/g.45523 Transcript_21026/m.45523 type:complete len:168 (-) Transcript_21026:18-521(-)